MTSKEVHLKVKYLIAILTFALLVFGCSTDKKATELLDTARFEEKQNNNDHAIKLYNEIIQKHPDSPAAKTAKTRLQEIHK